MTKKPKFKSQGHIGPAQNRDPLTKAEMNAIKKNWDRLNHEPEHRTTVFTRNVKEPHIVSGGLPSLGKRR